MTFRLRDLVFSLNSYLAMLLALFIAFSLDLPRPYWAMLTVYITIQPLSGALRSKAVYRVLGTIMGGIAAVILVPNLANSPIALSLALSSWVGLCLYMSLLDRTPRSYIFLLAGYTAAIIGFPSVNAPDTIFTTAVNRVEEIVLGIVCAVLIHSIIMPRSITAALFARATKTLIDVENWSDRALKGTRDLTTDAERRRLAADVTELHVMATHLPFDTTALRPTIGAVGALQDNLAIVLPLATGIEDRLYALKTGRDRLPSKLSDVVGKVSRWITQGHEDSAKTAVRLEAECISAEPEIDTNTGWSAYLTASAAERSRELVERLQNCRDLTAYIGAPGVSIPTKINPLVHRHAQRPFYRDRGLAFLSSAAAAVAILACCTLWIGLAWPDGASAATFAAVFSSFFATLDDPAPALVKFLIAVLIALPIAALYLFAVLPAIDGFPMLAVVLAPFFLFLGYLQADPRLGLVALPFIIGVAGSLSLQENFTADFAGFVNSNIGLILGIVITLIITRLFRSVGAEWSARRLFRAGWLELSRVAIPGANIDRIAWTAFMVDRLGLLTPRLAEVKNAEFTGADGLNDLRTGLNIIELQTTVKVVNDEARAAITRLLHTLSAHFLTLRIGRLSAAGSLILDQLDTALATLSEAADYTHERYHGLIALTGLRRNLFPDAEPYHPPNGSFLPKPAT